MRKSSKIVVFAMIILIALTSNVINLNFKNFDQTINQTPYTLVYVFSPSCGYCKEFTPKYDKIANHTLVKTLDVQLAKLDASKYGNISQFYEVFAYPGLLLFRKGVPYPIHYRKQRQINSILSYLNDTAKPGYEDQLLKYVDKWNHTHVVLHKVSHFYGQKDSRQFNWWDIAVKRDGYISWAFTQSEQTKAVIGDTVITQFENFTRLQDEIKKTFALLNQITEESWLNMVQKRQFTIFYVNTHGNKVTNQLLYRLAKQFYRVNFITMDGEHDQYQAALRQIGINDQQNIIAVDKLHEVLYIAPSPYTQEGLREFIIKAQANQLQIYKKTQKTNKLNKLTRQNFQQKMSTDQDVLLFLYDKKVKISKELMSLFEFLLLKFKHNKNILLLRCDVGLNEIEQKLQYTAKPLPKIIYYRKKMKQSKHAIFFSGSTISAKAMLEFIEENATFDFQFQGGDL